MAKPQQGTQPKVIDFQEVREKKLEEKRTRNERVFMKEMLGIYCMVEGQERAIEIVDVSDSGLAFRVEFNSRSPWPTELKEVKIRLYFNQTTYLPLILQIRNSAPQMDGGRRYIRYGCVVDPSTTTYEAYLQFVKFIKLYSVHAHKDENGVSHFFL
jgi:hypothetical protein